MSEFFNDSPIETDGDDRYGIAPFAKSIAKSILNMHRPVGVTIAIYGPWGSGKSSAINLIRSGLKEAEKNQELVVTDFKCWWYRGEEALALAFLQDLNAALTRGLGDKIKDLIPKLSRRVLQAAPVIGEIISMTSGQPSLSSIISKSSQFASTFFSNSDTVESLFYNLSKILETQDRKFLIIIDDIDRLTPDEALSVFRLVKSVGRLPNVLYLLAFDRELAEKIVHEKYPSEGPHFLEKIIQAGFDLPMPSQADLNDAVLTSITEICGRPPESQLVRTMNIFYDIVVPYITKPRDVTRFRNTVSVTWPAIANEVNLADFIGLEAIRLFEPRLYKAIRLNRSRVCGVRQDREERHNRFAAFLCDLPQDKHERAKIALQRLFPRLEEMGYGSDWISVWDAERRVCVEVHFDTYFRLSLSGEVLPTNLIETLIARVEDPEFIKATLREAARAKRRSGKSLVPVYLDALLTHAARVKKESVGPLLAALFEIHDEIDLEEDSDKGFLEITNTTLRFHWLIRRLTKGRFSIEERTQIYTSALQHSALGWLVDFVRSARDDYVESKGEPSTPEEDCLVTREAIGPLIAMALNSIRSAAADGSLLHHQDLLQILYQWREFLGHPDEIRCWADSHLDDDHALVTMVRSMMGQSWSFGMGGFGMLGDRVARSSNVVRISDDVDFIDLKKLRTRLEAIREEGKLDAESLKLVRAFLEAWDRQRNESIDQQ